MKKLFSILAICALTLSVSAQSTVKWPFGAATYSTVTLTSKQTTYTATVTNQFASIDFGTLDTTLAMTIIPGSGLKAGAHLLVRSKSDGTARTITPNSTYFISAGTTGTISKSKQSSFIYNGTKWVLIGHIQID